LEVAGDLTFLYLQEQDKWQQQQQQQTTTANTGTDLCHVRSFPPHLFISIKGKIVAVLNQFNATP
jgi:hypothetical protein